MGGDSQYAEPVTFPGEILALSLTLYMLLPKRTWFMLPFKINAVMFKEYIKVCQFSLFALIALSSANMNWICKLVSVFVTFTALFDISAFRDYIFCRKSNYLQKTIKVGQVTPYTSIPTQYKANKFNKRRWQRERKKILNWMRKVKYLWLPPLYSLH